MLPNILWRLDATDYKYHTIGYVVCLAFCFYSHLRDHVL